MGPLSALDVVTEPSRNRLYAWTALVGIVSVLGFAERLGGTKPAPDVVFEYANAAGEIVTFALVLAIVLWIAAPFPKREIFALRPPRAPARAVGVALGVLFGVYLLSALLDPLLHPAREQGLTTSHWQPAHLGAFVVNVVALAIVGPVVEELAFRGLGFRLLRRFGDTNAILLLGLAFGLWHGLIDALPILTAFGIGLAYLRSRTNSLYPCVLLHAFFNALAVSLPFVT